MAIMRVLQDKMSSFTYELSDSINFEEKELHTFKDLVDHVSSENSRLLMENTEGQVTITKVDRSLYAKAYYGQSFHLPINIDTDWSKELVAFKTKKQIPFELVQPTTEKAVETVEEKQINVPESKPEEPVVEFQEKSYDAAPKKTAPLNPFENDMEHEEAKEPTIVRKYLEEERELSEDTLDSLSSSKVIAEDSLTTTNIKEMSDITEDLLDEAKLSSLDSVEPKSFSNFLNKFKSQGLEQISEFVKTKNQKMYEEIRQLDHRADIREEVTSAFNKQYSSEKKVIGSNCQNELNNQIQAEKLRHEQAIQKIRIDIENNQSEKVEKLKNKLVLAKEKEISRRFEQETKNLAAIVKTKKAEAELQQEQLKSELQTFLNKAMSEAQMSQQSFDSKLSELNVSIPEENKHVEVEHGVVEGQRTEEVGEIEAYS